MSPPVLQLHLLLKFLFQIDAGSDVSKQSFKNLFFPSILVLKLKLNVLLFGSPCINPDFPSISEINFRNTYKLGIELFSNKLLKGFFKSCVFFLTLHFNVIRNFYFSHFITFSLKGRLDVVVYGNLIFAFIPDLIFCIFI